MTRPTRKIALALGIVAIFSVLISIAMPACTLGQIDGAAQSAPAYSGAIAGGANPALAGIVAMAVTAATKPLQDKIAFLEANGIPAGTKLTASELWSLVTGGSAALGSLLVALKQKQQAGQHDENVHAIDTQSTAIGHIIDAVTPLVQPLVVKKLEVAGAAVADARSA